MKQFKNILKQVEKSLPGTNEIVIKNQVIKYIDESIAGVIELPDDQKFPSLFNRITVLRDVLLRHVISNSAKISIISEINKALEEIDNKQEGDDEKKVENYPQSNQKKLNPGTELEKNLSNQLKKDII